MNAKELAKASGLHFNTVYKMIRSGELKCKKVGSRYYVDDIQAERLIRAKEIGTNKENVKETVDYVIGILEDNLHKNDILLLNSICKVSEEYKQVLEKIKDIGLSLDDREVIKILRKMLDTRASKEIKTFILEREEISKVVHEVEYIGKRYKDYEKESVSDLKKRFEHMNNNNNIGKERVTDENHMLYCYLESEQIEDILEDLERLR